MGCFDNTTIEEINNFEETTIAQTTAFEESSVASINNFDNTLIEQTNQFEETSISSINNFTVTTACVISERNIWTIHTGDRIQDHTGAVIRFEL